MVLRYIRAIFRRLNGAYPMQHSQLYITLILLILFAIALSSILLIQTVSMGQVTTKTTIKNSIKVDVEVPDLSQIVKDQIQRMSGPQFNLVPKPTARLAFLALVHDEATVEGLYEFLDVAYLPHHYYFIHLDLKAPDSLMKNLMQSFRYHPNVVVATNRTKGEWGGLSLVNSELHLLNLASALNQQTEEDKRWQHAILICGNTYPSHSMKTIEERMSKFDRQANIVFSRKGLWRSCDYDPLDRYNTPIMTCGKTSGRCMDEECTKMTGTPGNAVVYKGPQWFILSKDFTSWMFQKDTYTDKITAWLDFHKKTFAPDEFFFPTLLMDSPFAHTWNLTGWPQPNPEQYTEEEVQPIFHRTEWFNCTTYKNSHIGKGPCSLGVDDWDKFTNEDEPALFIRKLIPGDPLKRKLYEDVFMKEDPSLLPWKDHKLPKK
ncbi:glycosyltransferase family 14 protein [Conidiobolus coronatus NRRL 28638]|uniref:protein xylosyltransferase n=1 Tax=Conidiobolus coronatus (strain ATCC 28846 / CBS 209.66 / NRRL 28638) TaxID=796925 RepID=A0A137NVX4_CONC2|nr:glycosyltransferase family 14 protein [Conidiobolus coronatus NRRL 28638]|eukprot:KXN66828.1 glycosyltransferase family 14 protein [Conidiobolus coronatus NRRL 28638]